MVRQRARQHHCCLRQPQEEMSVIPAERAGLRPASESRNPVIKAVRAFTPAVNYWVPARASPVEPGSLGRDDSPYAIALPPLGGGITPQDPSRRFHFGKTGRAAIERKSVLTPELHVPVLVHIGCRPGPIERHCTLRDRKRDECRSGDGRDGMHGSQSPRMARNGGPGSRQRLERLFDVDQPVSERKACAQRLIGPLEDGVPGGSLPLDQSFRLVSAIEYEI